jgi:acetyl esterase/lipase
VASGPTIFNFFYIFTFNANESTKYYFSPMKIAPRSLYLNTILVFQILLAIPLLLYSYTFDSLNPIKNGYGANGPYTVIHDSIKSQSSPGMLVHLFRPADTTSPRPVLFFIHGIGASSPAHYIEFLHHCASRGNAVLYASYPHAPAMIRPEVVYSIIRKGLSQGTTHWRDFIDSTKLGIIGHSYGGGAVPSISSEWLIKRGWGAHGAFLFIMAPWYSYEITPQQLQSFPSHTTMIMQVYENDNVNDHRMAKDIFDNISIDERHKNFIILHSDTSEQPFLHANHTVPSGAFSDENSRLDNMDYYGVWRLADALEAFSFENDTTAYQTALGSGTQEQQFMGVHQSGKPVHGLIASHTSFILYPQNAYLNFWSHSFNPRNSFSPEFSSKASRREKTRTTVRNYFSFHPDPKTNSGKISIPHASKISFSPIDSGFGAHGPHKVMKRAFPHPSMGDGKVYIFSPENVDSACPVIIFLHGFPWPIPDFYDGLIAHIASQGYHVIFPSYILFKRLIRNKKLYDLMIEGADEAFTLLGEKADTTKLGFIGHAYGGGAVPAIAWHYLKLREWGKDGAFMFIISPWYSSYMNTRNFNYFPSNVNLLLQVYEDDRINDWRMAEDLFYSFKTIPFERKDFIIVRNDHYNGKILEAEHTSPLSGDNDDIDAIDYYGIYKLVDALAVCSFKSDSSAYKTALGDGAHQQTFMGTWPDKTPVTPLNVTDRPATPYNERFFLFDWNRPLNKRRHDYTPVEKARPTWLYKFQSRN